MNLIEEMLMFVQSMIDEPASQLLVRVDAVVSLSTLFILTVLLLKMHMERTIVNSLKYTKFILRLLAVCAEPYKPSTIDIWSQKQWSNSKILTGSFLLLKWRVLLETRKTLFSAKVILYHGYLCLGSINDNGSFGINVCILPFQIIN